MTWDGWGLWCGRSLTLLTQRRGWVERLLFWWCMCKRSQSLRLYVVFSIANVFSLFTGEDTYEHKVATETWECEYNVVLTLLLTRTCSLFNNILILLFYLSILPFIYSTSLVFNYLPTCLITSPSLDIFFSQISSLTHGEIPPLPPSKIPFLYSFYCRDMT